ncbi:MAG: hypothetical protein JWN67_632 [Actinomycetia bacterium]|nr:hypothetical protein [Actinomycetes bacterium]
MLLPWLLLAAPVVAAVLLWGDWAWVAVALAIAAVQFLALQRTQRFSARVWRTIGIGRRSRAARGAEALYLVAVVAGLAVLVLAVLRR